MMISLLFHRYPSVPCQGCTVTNFRCLPAERDTIQHTHKHTHPRVCTDTPVRTYTQTMTLLRLRTHTNIYRRIAPYTHFLHSQPTSLTEAAL
jgi:hypothetical protein